MATMDLQEKVEILLDLLEGIEECISSNPSSLSKEVGVHLADRLYQVAELADKEYNVVEIDDDSQGSVGVGVVGAGIQQGQGEGRVGGEKEQRANVKQESAGTSLSAANVGGSIKHERRVPSPPPPLIPPTTAPAYNRFTNPQPPAPLDEATKKRRREAQALVRQLDQKKKTFTCGVSYPGDEKEHDFSEGIKGDLRRHLPALKTHRHLFHYMAWVTMDRLECQHCQKCPNTYT